MSSTKWVRAPAIEPAPKQRSVNFAALPPLLALHDLHAVFARAPFKGRRDRGNADPFGPSPRVATHRPTRCRVRRKLRFRWTGLALCRTGLAPAGRNTELHELIASHSFRTSLACRTARPPRSVGSVRCQRKRGPHVFGRAAGLVLAF